MSALASALRFSILTVHLFGLFLGCGASAAQAFLLTRSRRTSDPAERDWAERLAAQVTERLEVPMMVVGAGAGALLVPFGGEKLLASPLFWAKMAFVAWILAVTFVEWRDTRRIVRLGAKGLGGPARPEESERLKARLASLGKVTALALLVIILLSTLLPSAAP